MSIEIKVATIDDIDKITNLGLLLYSADNTYESLYDENIELLKSDLNHIFLAYDNDAAVGFSHCSLRTDYVEGTSGGNVGYLEGIYVDPDYRNKGIAKKLVITCENWAKEKGCKEFASDCLIDNTESYKFHIKMGFKEANRIICFTKEL